MMAAAPDLDVLIRKAETDRRSIPLAEARARLGAAFREQDLADETLLIRAQGADIVLPPATWLRILRRVRQRARP